MSFPYLLVLGNTSAQHIVTPPISQCQLVDHPHWSQLWCESLLHKGMPYYQSTFSWLGWSSLGLKHVLSSHSYTLLRPLQYTRFSHNCRVWHYAECFKQGLSNHFFHCIAFSQHIIINNPYQSFYFFMIFQVSFFNSKLFCSLSMLFPGKIKFTHMENFMGY